MCFYSGFKRNVLTSGVEEMCFKNGSVEPARPCFFPVLRPLLLSTANHRNVSQSFILIAFRATLTTYHCRRGKRGLKMHLTNGFVAAARLCCSPAGAVWMPGHGVTVFIAVLNATFWVEEMCFKNDPLNRPGHAVSSF